MTIKEVYASSIKDYEMRTITEMANITTGYLTRSGKTYPNYLSNDSFKVFIDKMTDEHRNQYIDASGGELTEKRGRYGYYPPKMASFASSSRMIYLLSKDIKRFVFEQNLSTGLGGPANLDGYQFRDKRYTFVEAKRQEIFDSHSPVREAYRGIYKSINKAKIPFTIKCPDSVDGKFKPTFYCEGKEIHYFDIKQMISHMLGIARAFVFGKSEYSNDSFTLEDGRGIRFLYLLYSPSCLLEGESSLSKLEKDKIRNRYDAVVEEIYTCAPHMTILFEAIVRFQAEKEGVRRDWPKDKFVFKLVDQNQYREIL